MQRSVRAGRQGLAEEQYDALLDFQASDRFTEREKVALTYASAIIWNAEIADDALWAKLHQHFTVPELVELGFFIALTLGQQRWIKTLGIGHREVFGDTAAGLAPGLLQAQGRSPVGAQAASDTSAAQAKFEESGAVFLETFQLGGDAAKLYDITFRAVGIVEPLQFISPCRPEAC